MSLHTQTPDGLRIYNGHVVAELDSLAEHSVHAVCTSPPYFGLRDYGAEPVIWEPRPDDPAEYAWDTCPHDFSAESPPPNVNRAGNSPDKPSGISQNRRGAANGALSQFAACEHEWETGVVIPRHFGESVEMRTNGSTLHLGSLAAKTAQATTQTKPSEHAFCHKCGSWRGSYGQEPSISLYTWHTVLICRSIRRVLRPDGVLLWNVGDSYSGSGKGWGGGSISEKAGHSAKMGGSNGAEKKGGVNSGLVPDGLKEKDLCGVPFHVVLALQSDGWWWRQTIIWHKLVPMPESCDDRPTTAHEYIFLLTPSPDYYWDGFAVREQGDVAQTLHNRRYAHEYHQAHIAQDGGVPGAQNNRGLHARPGVGGHNLRSVWTLSSEPQSDSLCKSCGSYYQGKGYARLKKRVVEGREQRVCGVCGETNWVSHFAAFPTKIPRTAFLAGTSAHGVCPTCGAQWERVTRRIDADKQNPRRFSKPGNDDRQDQATVYTETLVRQLGWRPTCGCYPIREQPPEPSQDTDWELAEEMWQAVVEWLAEIEPQPVVPATVLDPFLGSGTSLIVARELGRRGIGIDLSGDYLDLATHRIQEQTMSLFAQIEEPEQGALI